MGKTGKIHQRSHLNLEYVQNKSELGKIDIKNLTILKSKLAAAKRGKFSPRKSCADLYSIPESNKSMARMSANAIPTFYAKPSTSTRVLNRGE